MATVGTGANAERGELGPRPRGRCHHRSRPARAAASPSTMSPGRCSTRESCSAIRSRRRRSSGVSSPSTTAPSATASSLKCLTTAILSEGRASPSCPMPRDPVDPLRRVQRRDLERERCATAGARACRTARRGPPAPRPIPGCRCRTAASRGRPPDRRPRARPQRRRTRGEPEAASAPGRPGRRHRTSRGRSRNLRLRPRGSRPRGQRGPGWRYGVLRARGLPRRIEGSRSSYRPGAASR